MICLRAVEECDQLFVGETSEFLWKLFVELVRSVDMQYVKHLRSEHSLPHYIFLRFVKIFNFN